MKNLFKTVMMFLCMLNFVSANVFGDNIQNKKDRMVNSAKESYFSDIIKSIDDTIKMYNKISIEKTLIDYNIVNKNYSYGKKIIRAECIQSILKIIGVTEDIAEYEVRCVHYYSHAFYDSYYFGEKGGEKNGFIEEYVEIAGNYNIIKGETIGKGWEKIYPERDVTLKECLQFMNSCLNKNPSDDIIYQAKKNGLIKDTDEILKREDETLSYDDFCTLLYRMLTHKVGYYFKYDFDEGKGLVFSGEENTDVESSVDNIEEMRYIDYLDSLVIDERIFIRIKVRREEERKYLEEQEKEYRKKFRK